jgi:hypothetical protein
MIYDAPCSPPGGKLRASAIYGLEDLGFVPRGEAGALIAEGSTRRGDMFARRTIMMSNKAP